MEVVAGIPFDAFLGERIFRPLGMVDTGFYVPQEKLGRLAEQDPKASAKRPLPDVTTPPRLLAGGHGLVSTVMDYTRFAHMLLHGGILNGTRILSRKTVDYMTADHLGPLANRTDPHYFPGPGSGYGLGVAVRLQTGMYRAGPVRLGTISGVALRGRISGSSTGGVGGSDHVSHPCATFPLSHVVRHRPWNHTGTRAGVVQREPRCGWIHDAERGIGGPPGRCGSKTSGNVTGRCA